MSLGARAEGSALANGPRALAGAGRRQVMGSVAVLGEGVTKPGFLPYLEQTQSRRTRRILQRSQWRIPISAPFGLAVPWSQYGTL